LFNHLIKKFASINLLVATHNWQSSYLIFHHVNMKFQIKHVNYRQSEIMQLSKNVNIFPAYDDIRISLEFSNSVPSSSAEKLCAWYIYNGHWSTDVTDHKTTTTIKVFLAVAIGQINLFERFHCLSHQW
jgi:hypothetical protein